MRVVHEAIGQERKHEPREQRSRQVSGERPDQQEHARPGQGEPRQQKQIAREQRLHAQPDQRRGRQGRHQHRVRVCERPRLGIEDVGVEEVPRIPRQLVRDPREAPRRQQRIADIDADPAVDDPDLRIGHHNRQRSVEEHHRGRPWHDPRSPKERRDRCLARSHENDVGVSWLRTPNHPPDRVDDSSVKRGLPDKQMPQDRQRGRPDRQPPGGPHGPGDAGDLSPNPPYRATATASGRSAIVNASATCTQAGSRGT